MTEKGICLKHGEFNLMEGYPQCLAEKHGESVPIAPTSEPEVIGEKPATTVIISVKPETNGAIIKLYDEAVKLQRYAETRIIKTDGDIKVATDDLSVISRLKKAIEEKRKEYIQPINEHLKAVDDVFKNFTEPLNQADSITRQKILDYRKEQDRIREEQERINRLRMDAARAEMELKGEITEPVELVKVQPKQANHYRTGMGTLGTATIRKWEVENFSLVPDEYKMPDSAKIGKVVRAGIASIPGIRIWEEETLRVTAKKED